MNAVIWGLVGAPVLAALIGLPMGRRNRARAAGIGIAGSAAALICALAAVVQTWDGSTVVRSRLLGAVDLGRVDAVAPSGAVVRTALDWSVSAPTALVCVAVTAVALAVQVYSAGYLVPHAGDTGPLRYAPYAATVSLFTAAMLVVVGADDLLLLLVGWEVMGLCSYLLVGHHSERTSAKRAALQAFLVTRVADIGFVIGVLALAAAGGTTNIPHLVAAAGSLPPAALALAMTGLVIGVAGKSAQFPFHGWLPDAMEGPTPVSALIHAATMVAAGVVVLVRLGPLLDRGGLALTLLAATACLSMLGAGLAALCSEDLKRALAWSTISQIAVMLAAVALGSDAGRAGALMLMLAHAMFKALLFLGAGMVAVRFGSTRLDGVSDLWRRDRRLAVLLGIGLAGLAAVPPLAGFVGKEGVLTAAEHAATGHAALAAPMPLIVLGCLGLTTLVTGLYSGRLFGALTRLDRPVTGRLPAAFGTRAAPAPASTTPPASTTSPATSRHVAPTVQVPDPSAGVPSAHPGPSFQAAPVPSETSDDEDETLSFVDGQGQVQDWDLIADLDSSSPRRWTRAGRARRTQAAEEARRRLDAGLADKRTERLARAAGPRVRFIANPDDPGEQPTDQAEPPNRLARAMRGQRVQPAAQLYQTAPLDVPEHGRRLDPPERPRRAEPARIERAPIEPVPGPSVPTTMVWPVCALAAATVVAGILPMLSPAGLPGFSFGVVTAVVGTALALAGVGLGLLRGADGHRDVATRLSPQVRAVASGGFGYQRAQEALVIGPTRALARLTAAGDDAVIGTWLQAPRLLPWAGRLISRVQTGQVADYLGWLAGAVVVVAAVAGLAAKGVW